MYGVFTNIHNYNKMNRQPNHWLGKNSMERMGSDFFPWARFNISNVFNVLIPVEALLQSTELDVATTQDETDAEEDHEWLQHMLVVCW